jgi:hypothetical protein
VRTDDSIAPNISASIHPVDAQSAQYSCEVTVSNVDDKDFGVVDVGIRLPRGMRVNEAIDSTEVEVRKRHEQVCEAVSATLTSHLLLKDRELAKFHIGQMRDELRKAFRPKSLFEAYFYLFLGRMPKWIKTWRERHFKIDVCDAEDAAQALAVMKLSDDEPLKTVIQSYINRLKNIESHRDYKPNGDREVTLKKGQQYKVVYVVEAQRGRFSPNSYSVSFDIIMRRKDYSLSRVEHKTLTVPTGHVWTTAIAVISALIGATTQHFNQIRKATYLPTKPVSWESAWAYVSSVEILLPILTSIIVFTIFDMTSLRDKFNFSRDWRLAVFIGFVCGFLTDRILGALGELLG